MQYLLSRETPPGKTHCTTSSKPKTATSATASYSHPPEPPAPRPSVIRHSLRLLASHHPRSTHGQLSTLIQAESCIQDFLSAGDPAAVDANGNTALHYLARGLGERAPYSAAQRRLFKLFLDHGVDINARNFEGRTCAWVYFDDDGEGTRWVEREYPHPHPRHGRGREASFF